MANFSRIRAENQFVFLNTGIVWGINSLSIKNNFGAKTVKYIGYGVNTLNETQDEAQYSDVDIGALLVDNDNFISQSGLQPMNCFIFKNPYDYTTNYSLLSGYLTSYSAKYQVNQPAQITSNFRFYNLVGNLPQSSFDPYSWSQIGLITGNTYPQTQGNIADTNYCVLTLNESTGNRVSDFTFTLNYNRLPIYNVGTRYPKRIETIFPVNVTCDITFDAADNFSETTLPDFPLNRTIQNLELDVYSNRTNNSISYYKFQNMTLISSDRDLNTEGNLIIKRKYRGQLFDFIGQSGLILLGGVWDFGFVYASASSYIDWGFVNTTSTSGNDFGLAAVL